MPVRSAEIPLGQRVHERRRPEYEQREREDSKMTAGSYKPDRR